MDGLSVYGTLLSVTILHIHFRGANKQSTGHLNMFLLKLPVQDARLCYIFFFIMFFILHKLFSFQCLYGFNDTTCKYNMNRAAIISHFTNGSVFRSVSEWTA